jgi:hypothetical protein
MLPGQYDFENVAIEDAEAHKASVQQPISERR